MTSLSYKSLLLITLVIICAVAPLSVFAQEGNPYLKDFQTWSSIDLEKSLSKKWNASLSEEIRLRDNSTRLRTSFTDAGVKWKPVKNFTVGGTYRLIIKTDQITQRLYCDFSYRLKKNNWSLTPRIRLQHEFISGDIDENYIRPALKLQHKINKRFEPFATAELFYHALYYKGNEFDEYRLSAGTDYNFDKKNSLTIFYLLEQELNVNAAKQAHVFGIGFNREF